MQLKTTIGTTPCTIEGDPGEMLQLLQHLAPRSGIPPAAPATPKLAAAPGAALNPRPKCTICSRNHRPGKCKKIGLNAAKNGAA